MKLMLQVTLTLTNEIINPITDDGDDLHTQSASKFLCYHFNNLIDGLNEDTYKIIRHTLISDNKYALEVLQSTNWSYFIEKMLQVSQGNISSLNMSRVSSDNENNFEDIKIVNDTIDNLTICKDTYSYFYSNIGCALQRFLQATHKKYIEKMEKDLAQNHYFINLKNEQNTGGIYGKFLPNFSLLLGDFQELLIIFLLF